MARPGIIGMGKSAQPDMGKSARTAGLLAGRGRAPKMYGRGKRPKALIASTTPTSVTAPTS